jgi:hypothetical protein
VNPFSEIYLVQLTRILLLLFYTLHTINQMNWSEATALLLQRLLLKGWRDMTREGKGQTVRFYASPQRNRGYLVKRLRNAFITMATRKLPSQRHPEEVKRRVGPTRHHQLVLLNMLGCHQQAWHCGLAGPCQGSYEEYTCWNRNMERLRGKLSILLGTRSVHSAASHMKNVTCHEVEATGSN